MDPDAAVLVAHDLRRSYGRWRPVEAVRGVSFAVGRGEVFGLIGPDGAGKTSIIQMLAAVLRPHGGTASVAAFDVRDQPEAVKARIGYMPQGLGSNLYDSLTVRENIEFFRDLRQLSGDIYARNRAELLAATRLEPFLERRAANLSGGMRQKLALVCTLIHLPDVLLLDEPTTGVDPISRQEFWQIIQRVVRERRSTVLLSTSYMDEAERCHRIALLHAGRIAAEGAPDDIRRRATGLFARMTAAPQSRAVQLLRFNPQVRAAHAFGDDIHIEFTGELRRIESNLTAGGIGIQDVAVQAPGLEDVLLQIVGTAETRAAPISFEPVGRPQGAAAIACTSVTRRFGTFIAVDRLNLSVEHGEIFGLLGPNGAGKTTLIKMMCGLLEPSDGTIAVGGLDVANNRTRVRMSIGYMSQRFSLYQDLTVRQNLRLYASLYGVARDRYLHLADRLGLMPLLSRLTRDLPAGVKQRVLLVCAILHRPSIVFLDEPTSGVDPEARRVFWDLIYALSRDAGVTVVVSTHYMDEAAHCDRLGLIHQARLVAIGAPAALRERSARRLGHPVSMDETFIDCMQMEAPSA